MSGATDLPVTPSSPAVVAGIDLGPTRIHVQLRDPDTGALAGEAAGPLADPRDPLGWVPAVEAAVGLAAAGAAAAAPGPDWMPDVVAMAVVGDEGGFVPVGADGQVLRDAILADDPGAEPDAGWLQNQVAGGAAAWAEAVGSPPTAAHTIAKLSLAHRSDPATWAALDRVCLPQQWVTAQLGGEWATDRGAASTTGFWSPATDAYRWDLLAIVDRERDWERAVPRVCDLTEAAGFTTRFGGEVLVAPGTARAMATALALGLEPGDAALAGDRVLSVSDAPVVDASGRVACRADATGRFLLVAAVDRRAEGGSGAEAAALEEVVRALALLPRPLGSSRVAVLPQGSPGGLLQRLANEEWSVHWSEDPSPAATGACLQAAAVLHGRDPAEVRGWWSGVLGSPG